MAKFRMKFMTGWKPTGRPNLKTMTVEAENARQAAEKVKKKYPSAGFITAKLKH